MGIFGRKRRKKGADGHNRGRHALPEPGDPDYRDPGRTDHDDLPRPDGPYDEKDAPDDGRPRMDLGSVRVPVPEGAQVQVELDKAQGSVRAVHVVTPYGQATISAYAAPRSTPLWPEVADELTEQLRGDGAKVTAHTGEWGRELAVRLDKAKGKGPVALYFVGVDAPRWMLRGVIAGPEQLADQAPDALRDLVRETVVHRGDGPMPVRAPLPIKLPEAMAQHIEQQRQQ